MTHGKHACSREYLKFLPPIRGCCKGPRWSSSKPFVRAFVNSNWDMKGDKAYGSVDPAVWPTSKRIMKGTAAFSSWSTCAVVGNSGHLLRSAYGDAIDAHDVVMRMNQAPTKGYEKHVGSKTTHRLLNRLWTLAYASSKDINAIYQKHLRKWPLEPGVTLISSRTEPGNFLKMREDVSHAPWGWQRKDVTSLLLARNMVMTAGNMLRAFRPCLKSRKNLDFAGGNVPSSGLVATVALRHLCKSVTVYGFGSAGPRSPYQYYQLGATHRKSGNPVHTFETEELLMRTMAKDERIRLCDASGCVGSSTH